MIVFRQLLAAITKETRLIVRDWHALAVLFVMPVAFVTIMSLALRDVFTERGGVTFSVLIVDQDGKLVGEKLRASFARDKHFHVELAAVPLPDAAQVEAQLTAGHYKFALLIPSKATEQARRRALEQVKGDGRASGHTPSVGVRLLSDPTLRADHRSMLVAFTNGALRAIESQLIAERIAELARTPFSTPAVSATTLAAPELFREVSDELESSGTRKTPNPTSVQQNAPGWTLLAMFFLAIPLSVTLIKERAQGSLLRLQSMPVPTWVLFGGKITPYLVINQLQLALILAVGVWGLPLLGGDRLTLGNAPEAIALLSVSASLAAIGFALLIATFARTQEQATTFSATTVLILAALGGIMVPKLVMPPAMQQLAELSPFSWGLDGFLDIFIRGGGVREVLPEAGRLLAFGVACFVLAILRFNGRLRHN
jgi:ABC-2 type transport system permease protein